VCDPCACLQTDNFLRNVKRDLNYMLSTRDSLREEKEIEKGVSLNSDDHRCIDFIGEYIK
jgi:hypothetical protein